MTKPGDLASLIVIAFVCLSCNAVEEPVQQVETATVRGTASSPWGEPLEGISVSIGETETKTGSDGGYVLDGIPVGEHVLHAFHSCLCQPCFAAYSDRVYTAQTRRPRLTTSRCSPG